MFHMRRNLQPRGIISFRAFVTSTFVLAFDSKLQARFQTYKVLEKVVKTDPYFAVTYCITKI
jgi:hypothetical protein